LQPRPLLQQQQRRLQPQQALLLLLLAALQVAGSVAGVRQVDGNMSLLRWHLTLPALLARPHLAAQQHHLQLPQLDLHLQLPQLPARHQQQAHRSQPGVLRLHLLLLPGSRQRCGLQHQRCQAAHWTR
jgi:hypothetical protein